MLAELRISNRDKSYQFLAEKLGVHFPDSGSNPEGRLKRTGNNIAF